MSLSKTIFSLISGTKLSKPTQPSFEIEIQQYLQRSQKEYGRIIQSCLRKSIITLSLKPWYASYLKDMMLLQKKLNTAMHLSIQNPHHYHSLKYEYEKYLRHSGFHDITRKDLQSLFPDPKNYVKVHGSSAAQALCAYVESIVEHKPMALTGVIIMAEACTNEFSSQSRIILFLTGLSSATNFISIHNTSDHAPYYSDLFQTAKKLSASPEEKKEIYEALEICASQLSLALIQNCKM